MTCDACEEQVCAGRARHRFARRVRRGGRAPDPHRRHQPLHRADAVRYHRRLPARDRRGGRALALPAHRRRGVLGEHSGHHLRGGGRRAALSLPPASASHRDLGGGGGGGSAGADVSALSRDLRTQRIHHRDDGFHRRACAHHPQDARRAFRHAAGADQCGAKLQPHPVAAILEDSVSGGAPDHLRGLAARADLLAHQHRRGRVPDQFRRARAAYQRARRALRSGREPTPRSAS